MFWMGLAQIAALIVWLCTYLVAESSRKRRVENDNNNYAFALERESCFSYDKRETERHWMFFACKYYSTKH